jgi:hypothetical protein
MDLLQLNRVEFNRSKTQLMLHFLIAVLLQLMNPTLLKKETYSALPAQVIMLSLCSIDLF